MINPSGIPYKVDAAKRMEGNVKKIIEVKNLYKLYRVGDSIVRALNGVDFAIYEGEFCAIVGTSGSGKSTLLNMLAGLEKPTKGEVIIDGVHMETLNEEGLVRFRRENVGFIFQSFHLLGTMNALENVALPLSFRGESRASRLKKADQMLDLVKLKKHKKHLPSQMSGGQQQGRCGAGACSRSEDHFCGRTHGKSGFPHIRGSDGTDAAGCEKTGENIGHGNP